MRERQRYKLPHPVHIEPGDHLVCRVDDREKKKAYQFTENCGRKMVIDTVVTFDVDEPMLGLVDGIGAIFGDSGERK